MKKYSIPKGIEKAAATYKEYLQNLKIEVF